MVFILLVEVDCCGVYVVNIEGMWCVVVGLVVWFGYVFSDGFCVLGLLMLLLLVIGGDVVVVCIVVVSVFVKVSWDCVMVVLDVDYFGYGFVEYKGYSILVYSWVLV